MNNLFSSFDPNTSMTLPLNWIIILMGTMIMPGSFWVFSNQSKLSMSKMLILVSSEFKSILGAFSPGNSHTCVALFLLILTMNFSGLLPYVFPASSHLVCSAALGLPLWVGYMGYGVFKAPKLMLAHLVPNGTPGVLMPFMVMIELVSNLIRPLTLSVRLAANIIAGHLLLTLLSSLGPKAPLSVLWGLAAMLLALSVLESAVGLIQAYVFSVLSTLYLSELNTLQLI